MILVYGLYAYEFDTMADMYHIQVEDKIIGEDCLEFFTTDILDAKYEWNCVRDVVQQMDHLSQTHKDYILKVLQKKSSMNYGTLGFYPHNNFHVDVDLDTNPVCLQPYPLPRIHLSTFKKELDHLVELGFLVHQNKSEWNSPTFIVSKKDAQVLWIRNPRQLNKVIKRKQYCLPIITDILLK